MPLQAASSLLRVEQADDITVVRFTTSQVLGQGPCEAIRKQLFGLVEGEGRRKLLLDLTGVERLDSDVVAKLVWLDQRVKAAGGRLALCHLTPALSAVFQTLQLHRLLSISGDEQAAVQTFR